MTNPAVGYDAVMVEVERGRVPLASFWREWSEKARERAAPGWVEMIEEMRRLQDTVAATAPPAETVASVTALLAEARRRLSPHTVDDEGQIYGKLLHLPGRGQTLSPPLRLVEWSGTELVGETTFGRFHCGSVDAAHGGAVALVFDEALGRLADIGRSRSRTASLRVDFRSVTPVGRPLVVRARLLAEEGRKRRLHGALLDGDRLCAEAEGLFVGLRPGQH